jgi:DNA-binding CsgD family transcriptional regulator/tetratricopeptide (TPR) repeat protein
MLLGRTGLSPTMVGRSVPLTRLSGLLTSAGPGQGATDRPSVALVAGEAGIGKTRLLHELIASVPSGTTVLAGQAEPGALGRPFELVQSLLGSLPEPGDDPVRAAVDAIGARLGPRSLVVFEDLHWADAESVAVFERLAGLPRPSLLLVGTYRPDELTRRVPASEALLRLERRHRVQELRLDRLGRIEVGAFLAAVYRRPLPSSVIDALANRTGGNPFFLEELLMAAGDAEPEALCAQPLPWSLTELVQRQLDGLSAEERRVVEAAAVLGRRASFDLLASMTRCTEDELIGHLSRLVERGLLVEERDDEFSFRHALVRDAVEGQLLGRERRRLHAVALAALQEGGSADLAQMAHHAGGAGQYDELVALARVGVKHYLSRGSSHQALLLALEALPEAPDDLVLLGAAARAAWLVGQLDEALTLGERAMALARRVGDLVDQSEVARLLARLYHDVDRADDLWAVVNELERITDQLPTGEDRARNLAYIAQMHMLTDGTEEAVRWADLALAEAERADAKPVRAQALVERGSALAFQPGHQAEGEEVLRQGIAEAEAVGDWVSVARGLNNLLNYVPTGSAEHARLIDQLRTAADRAGFDILRAYSTLRAARQAMALGDQRLVLASLAEAAELLPRASPKGDWIGNLEALVALEQGRPEVAQAALDRAPHEPGPDDAAITAMLRLAVLTHTGRSDRAEAERLLAAAISKQHLTDALEVLLDLLDVAERAGFDVDVLRGGPVAAWSSAGPWPPEHHALIEAVLAGADPTGVEPILTLVDDEALSLPAVRRAALLSRVARARAAAGDRAGALEAARSSRAVLDRWPGWRREEVDELIRRLDGARVGDDGPAGLSPREREVAVLVAEGLSNAELARRLYISPKTAAVHVSNILGKLGMSSRAEVAAWAVRTGLAEDAATRPA